MSPAPWKLINSAARIRTAVVAGNEKQRKLNSSLEASSCTSVFMWNTLLSAFLELIAMLVEVIITGFQCLRMILCSLGNNQSVHRLMNDVSNNTSTARFWTIPKQVRTRRAPMRTKNITLLPWFTTLQFCIPDCSGLIDSMGAFLTCGRKSFLIKLGPAPELCEPTAVNKALDVAPNAILTRYVALQKNEAT